MSTSGCLEQFFFFYYSFVLSSSPHDISLELQSSHCLTHKQNVGIKMTQPEGRSVARYIKDCDAFVKDSKVVTLKRVFQNSLNTNRKNKPCDVGICSLRVQQNDLNPFGCKCSPPSLSSELAAIQSWLEQDNRVAFAPSSGTTWYEPSPSFPCALKGTRSQPGGSPGCLVSSRTRLNSHMKTSLRWRTGSSTVSWLAPCPDPWKMNYETTVWLCCAGAPARCPAGVPRWRSGVEVTDGKLGEKTRLPSRCHLLISEISFGGQLTGGAPSFLLSSSSSLDWIY